MGLGPHVGARFSVVLGAAAALGACTAVVAPSPLGPTIEVIAVNQSTEPATISYAFESEGASGDGESLIPACTTDAFTTGEVAGTLTVRVNGDIVEETRVPPISEDSALVLRVRIERDGDVFSTGPALAAQIPFLPPQPVACGPE